MAVIIIFIIFYLIWFKIRHWNLWQLAKPFKSKNVITFGPKGDGKDVVHSAVISVRKVPHMSNIIYNDKTILKPLSHLSVAPNTYNEFIHNDITVIEKKLIEEVDYYLSDGGIYLPSQYDNILSKVYPSLPITYAISRHLANMNIHANTQNLNRLWIKLREQADYYIWARGIVKLFRKPLILFGCLFIKVTHYENYEDALAKIRPIKKILNGDYSAVERSERGLVKDNLIAIPLKYLTYDSRFFHTLVYGCKAPGKKVKIKKGLIHKDGINPLIK